MIYYSLQNCIWWGMWWYVVWYVVVCGGMWRYVVVCGGMWRYVVVCAKKCHPYSLTTLQILVRSLVRFLCFWIQTSHMTFSFRSDPKYGLFWLWRRSTTLGLKSKESLVNFVCLYSQLFGPFLVKLNNQKNS